MYEVVCMRWIACMVELGSPDGRVSWFAWCVEVSA